MKILKHLSSLTTDLIGRESNDYLNKETDEIAVIESLKLSNNLEKVYRFDIGKSTDGPSPLINEMLNTTEVAEMVTGSLTEYPDNHYKLLCKRLAGMHGLDAENFIFGAGLEPMIDQISRAVLDPGDKVLLPVPNFDVFESASQRIGGRPVYVPLTSPDFLWKEDTVEALQEQMLGQDIKLLWISNPINPSGQYIPLDHVRQLLETAKITETFVVVDEAYGEYTDLPDEMRSASCFTGTNPHLMVLRTFSKIYCLPSARVGYMICASAELCNAVNSYRPMFPFSWFSLYMAQLAIIDTEHLALTRSNLVLRKKHFFQQLQSHNLESKGFVFLDSDTNTIMFRHERLSADELHDGLAKQGFLTANLNRLSGIKDKQFLRLTIHNDEANDLFLQACLQMSYE